MKKKKCIIVIPVYKTSPSEAEIASLKQGLKILGRHEITFITHNRCNISIYNSVVNRSGIEVGIQYFDSKYFSSIEGYNNLCLSLEFYERFSNYEYMLIYQLDAWVFRDELDYWCCKGYDYIGAPLFHAHNSRQFSTKFSGVGNGGFCLRRISHCLEILKGNQNKPYIMPIQLIKIYWNYLLYSDEYKSLISYFRIIPLLSLKMLGIFNNIRYYRSKSINEDLLLGSWSAISWGHKGNIPDFEEAMKFSFEVNPAFLYEKNDKKMPFGCHAFEKWEYDTFWSKYIKY